MVEPRSSLTIAVGGGKGGVGKSLVACNLGIAAARLGFRVVIVDADLGAANQHTMLGIERPGRTLQALLEWEVESIEELVMPTAFKRVSLVPGSGAVLGAADLGDLQKVKLIRHIHSLDAEVVIIDCGAGTNLDVVDLYDAADLRLMVVTPQLTSIQNAYAFLKSAVYRSLRQSALTNAEVDAFRRSTLGTEKERLEEVMKRVQARDPEFASVMRRCLDSFQASIVGNQLDNAGQRRVFDALSKMFKDFLSLSVPVRAVIPRTQTLHTSVTRRRPLLADTHSGPIVGAFMSLAEALVTSDVAAIRQARRRQSSDADRPSLPGPVANHVRAHQRVACQVPCIVNIRERGRPGMIVDVSRSGLGIRGPLELGVGQTIEVEIDGFDEPLRCRVARSNEAGYGVSFQDEKAAAAVVEHLFTLASDERLAV